MQLVIPRDYRAIADEIAATLPREADRVDRMRLVSDVCWDVLSVSGVSWIGFYTREPGADEMVLGPRRDKPACSPIELHGACGQACVEGVTLVVTDVARLGDGYVACDPRDLSELVIPCFDEAGVCWGVLDADSFERGCFDEHDARAIASILQLAGLTASGPDVPVRVI
ncbi:MAG: GAF domain-containing protein [Planctomycetota bacterium]